MNNRENYAPAGLGEGPAIGGANRYFGGERTNDNTGYYTSGRMMTISSDEGNIIYEGSTTNEVPHGIGKRVNEQGHTSLIEEGIFENNILIEGSSIYKGENQLIKQNGTFNSEKGFSIGGESIVDGSRTIYSKEDNLLQEECYKNERKKETKTYLGNGLVTTRKYGENEKLIEIFKEENGKLKTLYQGSFNKEGNPFTGKMTIFGEHEAKNEVKIYENGMARRRENFYGESLDGITPYSPTMMNVGNVNHKLQRIGPGL